MITIGIIGAGNFGANLACFIAEQKLGRVRLYDHDAGIAAGKALDLMEAAPVRHYTTGIFPVERIKDLLSADLICIAVGKTLAETSTMDALVRDNQELVQGIAQELKNYPGIVLVASEPLEAMTGLIQKTSGLPKKRVLSPGTLIDTLRMKYLIATQLGIVGEDVQGLVLGTHMQELIIPEGCISVGGLPISAVMSASEQKAVLQNLCQLDDQYISLATHTSAYYGPAAATATLIDAIAHDTRALLPLAMVLDGEYGIKDLAVTVPVIVGQKGIAAIVDIGLSKEEHTRLCKTAEQSIQMNRRKSL